MQTVTLTNEQIAALGIKECKPVQGTFFKIGVAYLIRCVTNYWTGRVVGITDTEILLEDAAWIADTGRFSDAIKTGKFNEVEPVGGETIVARGAIVDAIKWPHDLPLEQV